MMRDRRMDRFAGLPFSIGCVSQSSISVLDNQPKKAHQPADPILPLQSREEGQDSGGDEKPRSAVGLPAFLKPSIPAGLQKLVKSFKMSLSQLFVAYEDDEDEEEEREMVIGLPTDVQHVAHIGLDGVSSMKSSSWGSRPPHEFLSLPPPHSLSTFPPPHGPLGFVGHSEV